jgi:hypothetical protein
MRMSSPCRNRRQSGGGQALGGQEAIERLNLLINNFVYETTLSGNQSIGILPVPSGVVRRLDHPPLYHVRLAGFLDAVAGIMVANLVLGL